MLIFGLFRLPWKTDDRILLQSLHGLSWQWLSPWAGGKGGYQKCKLNEKGDADVSGFGSLVKLLVDEFSSGAAEASLSSFRLGQKLSFFSSSGGWFLWERITFVVSFCAF